MTSATIQNVTTENFPREVLGSSMPVGVDFWAPWCGPCRMMAPEMEKVAARLHGRVKVVKANVDEKGALTVRYQAISIPTLLVVHQGREIAHHVGFLPA